MIAFTPLRIVLLVAGGLVGAPVGALRARSMVCSAGQALNLSSLSRLWAR